MFYPLSSDYIKYLNDPYSYGMNYDQWKDKKIRQEIEKIGKNNKSCKFNMYSKYNY